MITNVSDNTLLSIYTQIGRLQAELSTGDYYLHYNTDYCVESSELSKIIDFSQKTGAKLSNLLETVQKEIEFLIENEEIMKKALATPKLTMKILKFLPVLAVALCVLLGGNPLKVYLSMFGAVCVTIGVAFWFLGKKIISQKVGSFEALLVHNIMENPVIQLSLIKVSVNSGLNLIRSLEYLYPKSVEKLQSQMPWRFCELPMHFDFLEQYYYNGGAVKNPIDAQIGNIKMTASMNAKIKGEELITALTIPLSACFLPSFIFLGIIPTIYGLIS